eukprot:CAMPEP_0176492246 /NCGR_PEP_ID=MMETSP0200_2-20121128/8884_1 /TAXON_ID=947934 /ORGANISM="Chaetoceros sp., Strain GSL56" /LENGTH=207 /DNA_ID=CAMNT_0017889771 /DNA_START=880 /DNA_END=1503 /DNA_ORIENTATION=-
MFHAYWGTGSGFVSCKHCNNRESNKVTLWFRGGDIFHDHPHPKYGQPPVDYYIKSIQKLQDLEVISSFEDPIWVYAEDWRNPSISGLVNHTSLSNFTFITDFSIPFQDVVHSIFCSKAVIVGHSSMIKALELFFPLDYLFLPRNYYSGYNNFLGPSNTFDTPKHVYFYKTDERYPYTPHNIWKNTIEQLNEILNYTKGNLVLFNLSD